MPRHQTAATPASGDLQRQPGLAHPAGPGQGHQPRLAQRRRGLVQLPAPADERAHLQRQIAGALGNRVNRRKVHRQIGMDQLKDQLRVGQIPQPELTQALQPEPATQTARHQIAASPW